MTGFASMSDGDRREAGRFWIEALAPYEPDEIRAAFIEFTKRGAKYPNPQSIVALILEARKPNTCASRATPLPPPVERSEEETRRMARKGADALRDMSRRMGG